MRTRAIGHHSNETIAALSQISQMDIHISPPSLTTKPNTNPKKKRIGKQTVLRRTITGIQQQKKNVIPVNLMNDNDIDEDSDENLFSETDESSISMQESNSEDNAGSGTTSSSTASSKPPKRVLPQREASKPRPKRKATARTTRGSTTMVTPKLPAPLPEIPATPPNLSASSPGNPLGQPSLPPEMNPLSASMTNDSMGDHNDMIPPPVPEPVPVHVPVPVPVPVSALTSKAINQSVNYQPAYIPSNSALLPSEIRQDGQGRRAGSSQRDGKEKTVSGRMEMGNGQQQQQHHHQQQQQQQPGMMPSTFPFNIPRPMSEASFIDPGHIGQMDSTTAMNWKPVSSNTMHLSVGQGAPFIIRNCTVMIDSIYNYGQDYHGVDRQQIINELDSLIGELRQLS